MSYELQVERLINASPEVVFDAFVDADAQKEWYPMPPGWAAETECDPRVGGVWKSTFGPIGEEPYREICVFEVVDRPRRLLMSATSTSPEGVTIETIQEITFAEEDGKTRMKVIHSGFPTEEVRDALLGGWPTSLEALDHFVTRARDQQAAEPNPALQRLGAELVGAWNVSGHSSDPEGDIAGQVTYEWMEGGHFLVQRVDLTYAGNPVKGVEYVRYDQDAKELRSHYFETSGAYFTYVYELDGDTLTIWGQEVGSPASFKAKISTDRNTQTGRWEWPGGGYDATSTRAER